MKTRVVLFAFTLQALAITNGSFSEAQTSGIPPQAQITSSTVWNTLAKPSFDDSKVAAVESVTLQRDVATLTLLSGDLGLGQPVTTMPGGEGRIFAAVFKGSGHLRFAPTLAMEKQQLAFHSAQEVLETDFNEAVFLFTDETPNELASQVKFRPGDSTELQDLYQKRNKVWTRYGYNWEPRLLKALLSDQPQRNSLFVAELHTPKHGWLTLIVDAADPEQIELVQFESSRTKRNAWTIWSKFPAEGHRPQEAFADALAHHDYRLRGYRLDVTVKENTELLGQAQLQLEMQRDGERVLLLALDPNLRISEVTDAAGQSLAFFQPKDPKDKFFLGDYLVVVSPEAFAQGTRTLRFTYAGKRIVRKMGGGNFFCQSFGWYPTYGLGRVSVTTNEFAGRSDFDITLRVPKRYQAVAVGNRVKQSKDKKYQITQWKSDLPLAVARFAFGDYNTVKKTVGKTRVEIYANKQPDDTFQVIERSAGGGLLPGLGGSRSPGQGGGGSAPRRPVGLLRPSGMAKEMATEVANSLRVMEKYFGPYPYKKLAVTNISYSYGQGWPSLLYLSAFSFLDSTQRHALGIRDHVRLTDFLRAHETSHQWWGHVVGWKSYHDQWLSEGFAEFSGILYTLFRRNPDEYLRLLRRNREDLLTKDLKGAVYEQIGPIYAGLRLHSGEHPGGYGTVVYKKGGWVLHMIRMMLFDSRNAEDPDARFIAMMQDFTRTFHNKPASTEDFKHIVEKHMTATMNPYGEGTMDWFFDSWVYGTGIPQYRLKYNPQARAGEGHVCSAWYRASVGCPR